MRTHFSPPLLIWKELEIVVLSKPFIVLKFTSLLSVKIQIGKFSWKATK
ncbi:hypothetical protein V7127_21915 [Bacillus sp. JJ1773]